MDEVMTVDVAMGRLERLEGYGLAVHPERCVRVRNRHASCVRCAEACTSGALSLRDGALTVNEALCVGCGTCATVCPTCAIEARHPVDGELLAAAHRALRAGREAVFACHRAFEQAPAACAAAGAIELACLSRMEESLAMRLFADGAQCIRKPAHVQADGTLPHFVPLRRHALLDALADLGNPVRPDLDTRLWGHVSIDMSACRSCKMCAVFCPTGALQKYVGEDGHGGVEHYPAECVHCGLCQDICPVQAITSSTAVPTSMLADGKTERYPMPDPAWTTGPDQILRKMTPQIHSREVQHSY